MVVSTVWFVAICVLRFRLSWCRFGVSVGLSVCQFVVGGSSLLCVCFLWVGYRLLWLYFMILAAGLWI